MHYSCSAVKNMISMTQFKSFFNEVYSIYLFWHCLQDLLATFVQAVMLCQKRHAMLLSFHEIWVRQGEVPEKMIKMIYDKEIGQIALLVPRSVQQPKKAD